MNTPRLETERLLLRKFDDGDMEALYLLLSDKDVNTFLPWFPVKSIEETKDFFENQIVVNYKKENAYFYAICLKEDNAPIRYVKAGYEILLFIRGTMETKRFYRYVSDVPIKF